MRKSERCESFEIHGESGPFIPGGKMPPSTAGRMPAATRFGQAGNQRPTAMLELLIIPGDCRPIDTRGRSPYCCS